MGNHRVKVRIKIETPCSVGRHMNRVVVNGPNVFLRLGSSAVTTSRIIRQVKQRISYKLFKVGAKWSGWGLEGRKNITLLQSKITSVCFVSGLALVMLNIRKHLIFLILTTYESIILILKKMSNKAQTSSYSWQLNN